MSPMHLLIRVYPAAWRRRYGAELEELLDGEPSSMRSALDLLRGAAAVRLHGLAMHRRALTTGGEMISFDWPQRHGLALASLALLITAPTLIVISLLASAALLASPGFSAAVEAALSGLIRSRAADLFLIVAPAVAALIAALSMVGGRVGGAPGGGIAISLVIRPRLLGVVALVIALGLTAFWTAHLGADFLAGRP
ncbi:MAG TPA: hypothetical protein VFK93_04445 [Candidatus Limnocylindria bacterium]|nr:hypothetical protein [Candidatus Limnocylindria bacterium]